MVLGTTYLFVVMSRYRIQKSHLLDTLENWDSLMNFHVHLVACGGTALTLMDIKESTKDVDFIVPLVREYERLLHFLRHIGYTEGPGGLVHEADPCFIYQFWCGARVFTTELLDSPLVEGKNVPIRKWRHIYLGALNLYDLIVTKIFRGTSVDLTDSLEAFRKKHLDPRKLFGIYRETASYDLNPDKMMIHFLDFADRLYQEGLVEKRFMKEVNSWR